MVQEGGAPRTIGGYRIEGLLGTGAFGAVYRARDPKGDRVLALKVIALPSDPSLRRDMVNRAMREVRIADRLDHPDVVRVHEISMEGDSMLISMDLVEGLTLKQRLERGPVPPFEAVGMALDVVRLLENAHGKGVVHRDIKPSNLMIAEEGRIRILDFGVSRMRGEDLALTRTGDMVGTPQYMAPEQIINESGDVDGRADLFSLGVVLYEMLTLRSPFAGTNVLHTLRNIEMHEPPPPSVWLQGLPVEIDQLVMKVLSKDREQRFRDASAMRLELERIRADLPGDVAVDLRSGKMARPAGKRGQGWRVVGAAAVVLGVALAGRRGSEAPATAQVSPVETPVPSLSSPRSAGEARARIERGLAGLAGKQGDAARLERGRLLRRLGSFGAALDELRKIGDLAQPGAARELGLAWLCHRELMPGISREVTWLQMRSRVEDDQFFRDLVAKAPPDDRLFLNGCRSIVVHDHERGRSNLELTGLEDDADLLALEALSLFSVGDDEGAANPVRHGLKLDPYHPGLLLMRARLTEEGLIEELATYLELVPDTVPERFGAMALAHLVEEDIEEAEIFLDQMAARGQAARARVWKAAYLLHNHRNEDPSEPFPRESARRLFAGLEGISVQDEPVVRTMRVVLGLAMSSDWPPPRLSEREREDADLVPFAGWTLAWNEDQPSRSFHPGVLLMEIGHLEEAHALLEECVEAIKSEGTEDEESGTLLADAYLRLAVLELVIGDIEKDPVLAKIRSHLEQAFDREVDLETFDPGEPFAWPRPPRSDRAREVVLDQARGMVEHTGARDALLWLLTVAHKLGEPLSRMAQDPAFARVARTPAFRAIGEE